MSVITQKKKRSVSSAKLPLSYRPRGMERLVTNPGRGVSLLGVPQIPEELHALLTAGKEPDERTSLAAVKDIEAAKAEIRRRREEAFLDGKPYYSYSAGSDELEDDEIL